MRGKRENRPGFVLQGIGLVAHLTCFIKKKKMNEKLIVTRGKASE